MSFIVILHSNYSSKSNVYQTPKITSRFPQHFCPQNFSDQNRNTKQTLNCLSYQRLQQAHKLLEKMHERRSGQNRVVYWTSLLTKYTRLGFIDEARALFDIMPERNIVSYNAMLSGYLHCGKLSEARKLFEVMPERNVVSWTAMLCGLADACRISEARRLFEEMPERNIVSWNAMVVGLIRNRELEEARWVFDRMPMKNAVSWNAIISGYVNNGRMEKARCLFEVVGERNVITWTTMITGFCRAGNVQEGYQLFRESPERNIVSWTAMIGGFAWNGFYEEALLLFLEMESSDIAPNVETFISLAYACAGTGCQHLCKQLHSQLIVNGLGYEDSDGRLSKSLIHMYSFAGIMDYARYLFNKDSNSYFVQSLNCMITGYIRVRQFEEAENLFDTVPVRVKITWTLMIDGYFTIGYVAKACYLFKKMPDKDAVAWTTMISGHVQNELFAEAVYFFSEMRDHGVPPLNSMYAILFGAVGAIADLDIGRQLHSVLIKTLSDIDLILDNSLISMYAKCGEIRDAYGVFSGMPSRDLISWNSIIMGFSHHGLANEALKIFKAMLQSGTRPNSVTFLGILSACSHAGMVTEGWELFNAMKGVYAVQPGLEHYISMINLLGRAGRVREAEELIFRTPSEGNHVLWGALLGVCGFDERNADIAKHAARRLLEVEPLNAPAHVALCNMYAANGQHIEEQNLRKEMGFKGVRKVPGCSWIVLNGSVHVFLSGDKLHPQVHECLLSYLSLAVDHKLQNLKI